MVDFYRLRLARHQKSMLKFLKYVFNDHFILVCMFGIGGFGYYYSNFVKTLDSHFVFGPILVLLIWLASLSIGKVATLLKEADKVFLLPKERSMVAYLKKCINYSFIFPAVSIGLLTAITMPILVATTRIEFGDYPFFVVTLLLLKLSDLLIQTEGFYLNTKSIVKKQRFLWLMVSVLSLTLNLYFIPWGGMILALLCHVYLHKQLNKVLDTHQLDWEKGIQLETKRMKKIYTFINLFTDVPGLTSDIKRRKYLDGWLNRIKKNPSETFYYLYTRVFVRGTEYSGLVIRLTVIGLVALFFSGQLWLSVIISMLFVYLIGFQLIPIYGEFDYMLMTALYPVPSEQKLAAVQKLLRQILLIVVIVFSLMALVALPNKQEALLLLALLASEWFVFTGMYVPSRLKKMQK